MNKPSKCKNCQWYGKPYWSIINPCDNCPMENVETFTVWQDPTIKEKDKEIERLYSIAKELREYIEFLKQTDEVILEAGINKILEKINEMLGSDRE